MHFRHNHGELDTIITVEFVHNKLKMVSQQYHLVKHLTLTIKDNDAMKLVLKMYSKVIF